MNGRRKIKFLILLCSFFWLTGFSDEGNYLPKAVPGVSVNPDEQAQDFTEEHESSGSEGCRQMPMQRLSLKELSLVLIVLAGSAGVILLDDRAESSKRLKGNG